MFKRIMESRKSMEKRIAELEAMKESMYKVIDTYQKQNARLCERIDYWQERYESVRYEYNEYVNYVEEQKEVMEDYLYVLKEKLEEAEGAEEYIAELEEELFKENPNHILVRGMAQYYGERDAIDAVCRVKDEVLLLMAPVEEVEEVVSEGFEVVSVGLERVGEVDEIIFLSELIMESEEVMRESEKRIKKALRGFKGNVSKSEARRTPPLPPHRRKAC